MNAEPMLMTRPNGKVVFTDPLAVSEELLETRAELAKEWVEAMDSVSEEHLLWWKLWRRWHLESTSGFSR